ncbi:MAG: 4Fe-4S binding protein [Candidatus Deferrimicrobiaceae bacterium]
MRFNEAACTGCGLCGEFCLEDAIRIHPKGQAADANVPMVKYSWK